MSKKIKMNKKKTLVSFLLIASVLFLAATVSATNDLTVAASDLVKVNDVIVYGTGSQSLALVAGDTIEIKVKFTIGDLGVDENGDNITSTSDLKMKVELEGNTDSLTEVSPLFDAEEGKTYTKTVTIEVPSDFDDEELSNDLILNVKIWNSDYKNDDMEDIELRVQKVSYELSIKSVITSNVIESGQSVPVDIVLKNVGYNDVEDIFVTVSIPKLGVEKKGYFGDLVSIEDETSDDDDEENIAAGRFYVEIPYTAKTGEYELTIKAENDETSSKITEEITIENAVSDLVIKSGEELVVINPTNKMRVYTIVYDSNEVTVVLPPASTKAVPIEFPAKGDYEFDVTVLAGETVLDTVKFSGSSKANITNPVFVLTIVLGIVFLVLVVVLVVLLTKKPQKAEEFGESYY